MHGEGRNWFPLVGLGCEPQPLTTPRLFLFLPCVSFFFFFLAYESFSFHDPFYKRLTLPLLEGKETKIKLSA